VNVDQGALARALIAPKDPRLRELYRRRPWRPALSIARCWLLILGALAFVAWAPTPIVVAIAALVIGTQQNALVILSHDAKHRNLFANGRRNDVVGLWLLSAPLGANFAAERRRHLAHHDRLGHEDDPDRDLHRAADAERLVTYRPSWIERLLIAPFHMGYHAEHHLWPAVPYYNLPRLATLVPESPALERRGGYGRFLLRYLRALPLAG
jgi:fatty acid desaturase